MSIVKIQLRYLVGTLSVYRPVSESCAAGKGKSLRFLRFGRYANICLRDAQGQRNLCYLEGF